MRPHAQHRRPRMQARRLALHPCTALRGRVRASHSRHTVQTRQPGAWPHPPPTPDTRGGAQAVRHFARCLGAPLPTALDAMAPSSKAHHCRSSGTAPRCRSSVSPGLEEPGQRALPRCKTGPSHRPGDRREEEPQRQSFWLAQGVLEGGMAVSTMAGDSGWMQKEGR